MIRVAGERGAGQFVYPSCNREGTLGEQPRVKQGQGKDVTNSRADKTLGLDQEITRRDFLNSTLLGSGALLLKPRSPAEWLAQNDASDSDDWTGYGGIGDYANSNGNTQAVLEAGHRIRDREFEKIPDHVVETGEVYDCVIVGGGIS